MVEKLAGAEVVQAILRGDADDELEMIRTAYKSRKDIVAARNMSRLRVGTRVRTFGLSPKSLNNHEGVITALPRSGNSKRFDVTFDSEVIMRGRLTAFVPGIPAACLEIIE